ncbi:MAG TPA: tetratricopeptide repeat protein, partial [Xanthomonadales bacterium]|nr:tetratricopeptide repeat protein [Xanthomonadales bacterium]
MTTRDPDAGIGRLQALFAEATTLPPHEREAFAREHARGDAALLRELLALIAADAGLDGMTAQRIESGFREAFGEALASVAQGPSLTGTRVGRFELREELGQGGMGRVYRATRVDGTVQQEAAIKFVRRDRLDAATLRRFRRERELAAGLDHPNIARLLDADQLDDGSPYYVMEYVRGVPIVEYCSQHGLDVRARVELVRKVCAAVSHAHGRLVVHRDLKPANILVADDGNPKLLDFGIAKLLDPSRADDERELTGTDQRLFSPQYAAPEQVTGAPVGVATDVHAIGLLLYELLSDARAWELGTMSAGQIERVVTQVVPRAPSAAAADAKDATTRARARQLRGDLDGIVMRCLRKAPSERYASVDRLDEDLANYLEGRPVVARGGHAWYRVRKWTRRNAGAVAAGVAIFASLVAGIVAFATQARIAEQRAAELEQVAEFQAEMLAQVDPNAAGTKLDAGVRAQHAAALDAAKASGEQREASVAAFDREWRRINATDAATGLIDETILKPAQAAIAERFADQPVVAARLETVLGERYAQLGLYEKALELHRLALETRTRVLGPEDLDTLESMNKVAQVLDRMSRYEEAYPLLAQSLELSRRLQGPEHQWTLQTQDHLGGMLAQMGRVDEGLKLLKETIAIKRRVMGNDHEDTLVSLSNLATLDMMLSVDLEEGAAAAAEAAAGLTKLRGPDDSMTLSALNAQGMLLWRANRLAEAEPIVRESLARRRRAM